MSEFFNGLADSCSLEIKCQCTGGLLPVSCRTLIGTIFISFCRTEKMLFI